VPKSTVVSWLVPEKGTTVGKAILVVLLVGTNTSRNIARRPCDIPNPCRQTRGLDNRPRVDRANSGAPRTRRRGASSYRDWPSRAPARANAIGPQ